MKVRNDVKIEFVNFLVGRGIYNDVVNLALGVYNFTPSDDSKIESDPEIVVQLRMDKACLLQLRDATVELARIIEAGPQPQVSEPADDISEGVIRPVKSKRNEKSH